MADRFPKTLCFECDDVRFLLDATPRRGRRLGVLLIDEIYRCHIQYTLLEGGTLSPLAEAILGFVTSRGGVTFREICLSLGAYESHDERLLAECVLALCRDDRLLIDNNSTSYNESIFRIVERDYIYNDKSRIYSEEDQFFFVPRPRLIFTYKSLYPGWPIAELDSNISKWIYAFPEPVFKEVETLLFEAIQGRGGRSISSRYRSTNSSTPRYPSVSEVLQGARLASSKPTIVGFSIKECYPTSRWDIHRCFMLETDSDDVAEWGVEVYEFPTGPMSDSYTLELTRMLKKDMKQAYFFRRVAKPVI
jgi:hypothetical protein